VSLILDALRKLEREKRSPQRGFVVVGSARPRPAISGAFVGAVLAAVVLVPLTWWLASRSTRPAGPTPSVVPAASAAPAPITREPEVLMPAFTSTPPPPLRSLVTVSGTSAAAVGASGSRERASTPRAPTPSASPSPAFVLQAITQRDGRPLALISDRLVREGDSLDGARVVHIGESEVELELAGRRLVITF
jgi:hypothetical protein